MKTNLTSLSFIFSFLLFHISLCIAQQPIGTVINGLEDENFGEAVALSASGERMAIGARVSDTSAPNAGKVQVFELKNEEWVQMGDDILGINAGELLGQTVGLSNDGNRLIVGVPKGSKAGSEAGLVKIFEWNGSEWSQLGDDILGAAEGDQLGRSVSISGDGNRIAVGAGLNSEAAIRAGQVSVYEWKDNSWKLLGNPINGVNELEQFGFAISISGDGNRLIVGAPFSNYNVFNTGHVQVYEWKDNAWKQLGSDIIGNSRFSWMGYAVASSNTGHRFVVGSPNNSDAGNRAGLVQVYEWIDNSWQLIGGDLQGEQNDSEFGYAVAMSKGGKRIAAGAKSFSGVEGLESGKIKVFDWDIGSESWSGSNGDIEGNQKLESFGFALSLSDNAQVLAVGAPKNNENGFNAGQVRTYSYEVVLNTFAPPILRNKISIYPNPAKRTLFFDGSTIITASVYDLLGKLISTHTVNQQQIDIDHLPEGNYYIELFTREGNTIKQFIKL